jgi:hypothetical protein
VVLRPPGRSGLGTAISWAIVPFRIACCEGLFWGVFTSQRSTPHEVVARGGAFIPAGDGSRPTRLVVAAPMMTAMPAAATDVRFNLRVASHEVIDRSSPATNEKRHQATGKRP